MTFNDFIWQVRLHFTTSVYFTYWSQLRKPIQQSARDILGYACRFITCLLTMEFILHFMYVVAIKDTSAWYGDSVAELSLIGFWNLIIVWLKVRREWYLSKRDELT